MKQGPGYDTGLSDAQLVHLYVESGRAESFNEIVRRHIRRVRAMIYQMVLNDADADDLTQEVFVKAMRGLPAFKGRADFSTWLYRITMNTTYRFLKKRTASPVELQKELPENRDEWLGTPDKMLAARELDGKISEAIASLTPPLRGAIVLLCLQQMDPKSAARIERCPVSTMYWRLHEARRILKERLGKYL
ncbi:MAG: sigma-70 family RNA polymerase sigma factor [Kiritimatiellae bacterium]|nr:sigma-70 family RNA polymerase sigma factor [Kiritimatiellia bacterium]